MDLPGGQLIVGAVGLAIIGYGVSLVVRGWTEKFREHLDAQGQSGKDGSAYVMLGKVGYIAKGIAIAHRRRAVRLRRDHPRRRRSPAGSTRRCRRCWSSPSARCC